MMASAFTFLMMATSVEKTRDLILRPNTRMPLHSLMQWGMVSRWLRRVPLYSGICFIGTFLSTRRAAALEFSDFLNVLIIPRDGAQG